MNLTLKEAATLLGRSPRQLRYMIRAGKITALKKDGYWRIESTDLPLTEEQRERLRVRMDEAKVIFDQAVEPGI
ncbi:MAG: helix-turn-helix domain-containing protein, partial [Planctomycetes bacterium]|nr:helix-turn-helix domain-containing protein [Planctomycetota bacterium]